MRSPVYKGYIWAMFIGLDQLGNALAGGHPDMTISARLGYLAPREGFWRPARAMVDWAFYPVDGVKHCALSARAAWVAGEGEKLRRGNDVGLALLVLFVVGLVLPLRIANTIRRWFR